MIANDLPSLNREDNKYPSFLFMHSAPPKNYNLVIKYPQKTISKTEIYEFLKKGFKF